MANNCHLVKCHLHVTCLFLWILIHFYAKQVIPFSQLKKNHKVRGKKSPKQEKLLGKLQKCKSRK